LARLRADAERASRRNRSKAEQAHPDPLADAAAEILQHMNADHKDALILLAREFAGIDALEVAMTSVDDKNPRPRRRARSAGW
jgi:hypothetical protein